MTKRYVYNVNKNTIECDGKFIAYVNSVDGFRIANKLTVLSEENEQLKFELKECLEHKLFSRRELEKENEQLKKEVNELKEALIRCAFDKR